MKMVNCFCLVFITVVLTTHAQEPSPEAAPAPSATSAPATSATGQVLIDVGDAAIKKSVLAFPALQYYSSDKANRRNIEVGQELFKVMQNDLTVANYFTFTLPEAFLEDPAKVGLRPAPADPNGFKYKNWQAIGTEFLIRGGYRINGTKLSLEIYAYNVPKTKLVMGKTYEGTTSQLRTIAHNFTNDLIYALTNKKGIFSTRLVVSMREHLKAPKEIYLMDWDGANVKKISAHKSIAISPAWSPKGDRIAYTAFALHKNTKQRNADLFTYEIASGRRWLVSYKKGINSGANFSPEGNFMYLTISENGTPDIYRMTLEGNTTSRLTSGPGRAMNVEPAVSPDGSKIAFSSDRSGLPMLYVMNSSGGDIKRLTFAGRYNSTPSWSPDGKSLVFGGYDKDHFDLFLINIDGTGLKRLTSATKASGRAADNRDPSFSPDGRMIVFTSNRTGQNQIYIIDPNGANERRITFDKFEWDQPKWSPYLN